MSKFYDGGPAFPCGSYDAKTGCEQPPVISGLSVRDYFAGQALAGLMADSALRPHSEPEFEHLAKRLYQVADAMLSERKKGGAE